MGRGAKSFVRGRPRYIAKASVLIICEDSKSAKQYLEDAKKYFDVDGDVEVAHVGKTHPLGIVETAVERLPEYQTVYCVIDRDTHPSFDNAIRLSENFENIEIVCSYPCFEYWLLLHFEYSRKGYAPMGKNSPGDQMVRALKTLPPMAKYNKGVARNLFQTLLPRLVAARENARKSLAEARGDGEMNPSTTIHELFNAFEVLSQSR